MLQKSRYLTSVSVILIWLLMSCAPPTAPLHRENGKTHGKASGAFFRHRWWNYYERGLFYAEGRFFTDALSDLEAAMEQRDKDQRMARTYGMHFIDYFPHREMGIVYYETGALETAKDLLLRSISQYPSAKAYFYLDQVRRGLLRRSGESIAPPRITLDVKGAELFSREDPVTIEGVAVDRHYVEAVYVNGRPLFMESAQTEFPFSVNLSLPQGSHPIMVKAANLAGKTTSRTIVVNVDRQGPLIAVEQIRSIEGLSGPVVELLGTVSDFSGVASAVINSKPLLLEPGKRRTFRYALPPGVKTLHLDAADRLGNHTSARIAVDELVVRRPSPLLAAADLRLLSGLLGSRDRTSPKIEVKGFSDSQTVFMDKVYLDGRVTDDREIAEISVNGEPVASGLGRMVFFSRMVSLDVGPNTIEVGAKDKAGNGVKTSIEVIRRVPEAFQLDARLKVSVLPFERIVSTGDKGAIFQEYLIDALVGQERFRVVERSLLDIILKEQRLSASNLIERRTALKVGRLVAAQSVIAGSIIETRRGTEVVSRMIDTETSDILATIDVYGETKDRRGLSELAEGMALKYHREFPLSSGLVVSTDGNSIFTDLGRDEIKLQRRVIVFREAIVRHPLDNRVLGTDKQILCRARVTQVQGEISKARLLDEPKMTVEKLFKVVAE